MPSISRIRIFNVSYDNNHIPDRLFNLYDASNTLFNLLNGGGKSVMVQLIFQPIIPGTELDKRKITDYMPKDSAPIHVMIEWILDDTKEKQYLLTGICMGLNRSERSESDEQRNADYRYFTYTHSYSKGNEYDIEHFPLKDDNGRIISYDSIRTTMKKINRMNFCIFPKSNLSEYIRKLEQYRIYKGEWELLQKINQKEGGLTNLFEGCKTSDKLFDEWILKTVSDCMPQARSSLIDMIGERVKPMLERKDDIREKELLERLSADIQRFLQNLNEYWNKLDEKEKKEAFFCGVREFEKQNLQNAENSRETAKQEQQRCKDEEKHIILERISEEIIGCLKEKSECETALEETKLKLSETKKTLDETEYKLRCMKAAELYNKIRSQKNKLNAARAVIESLENDETGIRRRNIGYTLYKVYSERSEEYCRQAEYHRKEFEALNDIEKALNAETERIRKQKEKYSGEIAVLEAEIRKFLEKEETFRVLIGRLPQRDLLQELVEEDVEEIRSMLEDLLKAAQEYLAELESEAEKIKQDSQHCKEKDKRLQNDIIRRNQELAKAETELDTCEKEIENIKKILREYDIDEKYAFEKESNLNLLNEKATEIAAKYDEQLRKLHRKKDLLDKLNKKQLHISREFAELLEKNGIDYQTGEDYLSAQPTEYLDDLLTNNDMLPYCFIVNDTDFEKTLTIDHETTIDRICPVVKRSSLGRKTELPNIHFYDLYNKESIDKRTSADYGKKLEADIESLNQSIAALERAMKKCNSDHDAISKFCYTSGMYSQLKTNAENAKKSLEDTLCQRAENEARINTLEEETENILEKIGTARENVSSADEKCRKFVEYLDLAQNDIAKRAELKELSEKSEQAAFRIDEISEKLSDLSKLKFAKNTAISNCEHGSTDSAEKANKFAAFENGEFLDNKIEQLEIEYESLSNNFSSKKEYQENICCEADKDIKKLSKKLTDDFSDLSKDDYDITYEEAEAIRLKAECDNSYKEYNKLLNQKEQYKLSLETLSKQHKRHMDDLKRYSVYEPLDASEIKGNYEARLDECRQKLKEAENDEKRFSDEIRYYEKRITILDKLIPDDMESSYDVPIIREAIDIPIHKDEFEEIKKALFEKKLSLRKLYEEIKNVYANENNMVVNTIIECIDSIDYDSLKNCYYSYEQLDEYASHIKNEIIIFRSKLENIENDKNHIIRHVYEHGRKLYNEVLSIFKNSYEKLQEGKGRHKIMEIDIADSLDNQSERRIADYVNTELAKLCGESENEHEIPTKLMNKLNRIFSDRNIFNAIANKSTYHIKVYKVNEIAANSHLELWESVYSGGERFVTCFMIFAALISYSRKSISGESGNDSRSVFLSDNPFGATSSPHLLDALLKITKKYKLQLICFTALNQSSITNEFDLIYQLALHRAAYSNRSYLKIDSEKKKDGLRTDSNLEFISLKYHSDQLSLF